MNKFQDLINSKDDKLIHENTSNILIDDYTMIEDWTLNRENWLFILELHEHTSREAQAAARERRFAQKRKCKVMRFRVRKIFEENILIARQNTAIAVTQAIQRVRLINDYKFDFIDDDVESKKKKTTKKKERVILNDDE